MLPQSFAQISAKEAGAVGDFIDHSSQRRALA
jgi:hypothetical protein